MFHKQWMFIPAIAGLLIGCDRFKQGSARSHDDRSQVATTATTQPSPTVAGEIAAGQSGPTTRPANEPPRALSILDGNVLRAYDFPRARIHIDRDEKTAVLYSDDPKNAIDPAYLGNSYYLVIPLTDESIQKLDGYQWHYKSPTSEHQESSDGVFLEGQRYHLQPSEVMAEFRGDGPVIRVGIDGDFFKFDTAQNGSVGVLVRVKGIVGATVDAR